MSSPEMKAVFEALLPPGAIWHPKPDGDFDHLLDGMGENAQEIYEYLNALASLRDPRQTTILTDLEKEYGLLTNLALSDTERRDQLAGVKYAKPTTASFDHMQDNLRAAGFAGIIVTPNDPAIDPALITGNLIVNGPIYIEQSPGYIMQANGPYAFAGHGLAVAGYFLNIERTAHVYLLPSESEYWRFIFFVGGAASGWPGSPAIAVYNVNYRLVESLIRLILKYKPLHSWAILVINAIMIWTARTAAMSQSQFKCATYGAGLHLIAGQRSTNGLLGTIETSPDGVIWTHQTPAGGFVGNFYGATYGNGLFVIVGENGEIQTSPDGINWTVRATGGANGYLSVTYGNGLFVVVGETGEIQTSPDGVTWTAQTPAGGFVGNFYGAIYGNGLYVIAGGSGEIQTSPDGITWTAQAAAGAYSGDFQGGAFGDNIYLLAGSSGEIQTSPDGITWTAQTAAGAYSGIFYGGTFGNGRFVIVGQSGEIQSSIDGITWQKETQAGSYSLNFRDVNIGIGLFVAVGQSAEIQTS